MKRLRFLLCFRSEENTYQRHNAATAQAVAQRLGVDAEILFAGNDAITQSSQLLSAIQCSAEMRPDGILCAPAGTSLQRVAAHAAEAGIGWALINREGNYLDELRQGHASPMFSVTVDQAEVGRLQGQQIGALLPEGGLVLCILGPANSPVGAERLRGMQATKPASVQVRTLVGNWAEESGYNAVSRWLQLKTSHQTPISLVAAQCDEMAMGARRAFEETAGAERERWTSLPYVGVDGCPGAGMEWVRTGRLTASVVIPATAGVALEMMIKAIQTRTQPPERTIVAPDSYPAVAKLTPKPAHA